MSDLKVHILLPLKEGAWGGGNQFLLALKTWLISKNLYAQDIEQADIILFNAYPFGFLESFNILYELKKRKPNIAVIHRVDGPISMVRGTDRWIDKSVFRFNKLMADGSIFQTEWSRDQSYRLGMSAPLKQITIPNAPNPNIFNNKNYKPYTGQGKIKIIATSWSPNWNKGFKTYAWMDKNLDWDRYEMCFVGNSPIIFKNIKNIAAQPSEKLSTILQKQHVYICASRMEPCSNALIEAMHCGLPAIGYNAGGIPCLIKEGGLLFSKNQEIPNLLLEIEKDYAEYQEGINLPSMEEVATRYYNFMRETHQSNERKKLPEIKEWNKFVKKYVRPLKHGAFTKIQLRLKKHANRFLAK